MNEEYYKNRYIELDKKLDRVIDSHTKLEDKIVGLQQENQALKDRIEKAIGILECSENIFAQRALEILKGDKEC